MAKELYFFLTKEDWLQILEGIEQTSSFKYILAKAYSSDEFNEMKEYVSLKDYNGLGLNESGNHQTESFLVLERDEILNVREVEQVDGGIRYIVDQLKNEKSVFLWPGGIHRNQYLICGHIATIHTGEKSKKIYSMFEKSIKKQCKTKVGRYYVGNEAIKLRNKVRFITININQSEEYDLKI